MVNEKDVSGNLHWMINVPDGTTNVLVPESGIVDKVWLELKGLALSIVSIFYYMRSLYESVGGNAMWAVMTVVVVFESTVGATLYKSINRAAGTFLAGSLGLGVHWIAYKSGEKFEPIIIGISVFFFTSAATFSRFIPSVKSQFDYGALIFILTFSLVSVSGYRVGELSELAYDRLSTIGIGTSFCILISMLFYPTWAGDELHRLIYRNLEKLADSLDGHVLEYFKDNEAVTEDNCPTKEIKGYKCVLDSKATEDNWTPAGIGQLKKHLSNACKTTNKYSSGILRELAKTIKTMTKSSDMGSLVWEMNNAVQELQNSLKSVPIGLIAPTPEDTDDGRGESFITPVVEVLPVTTLASLLIENAARINGIVDAVNELAGQVDMKPAPQENSKQYKPSPDTPH
ncbi:hypothetical protein GBA52_007277 [Prunus armeniaca]|nr:hypothetical protein GBA52_007277 [Prunus armeniaca]